jgi:FtsZ-binding cell division protein ZapB
MGLLSTGGRQVKDTDIIAAIAPDAVSLMDKAIAEIKRLRQENATLTAERGEARRELEEWRNSAAHVEADHPDEVHCGCVPVLRKLLTDARRERDEARREACKFESKVDWDHGNIDPARFSPMALAAERGWDCFKETK